MRTLLFLAFLLTCNSLKQEERLTQLLEPSHPFVEPQKAILCIFSCQLFLHPQGPRAGLASASCTHLTHTS